MIRFTEEELKNIKHVIVTMCLKNDKSHKIKGLFLGYKPLVESHTQLVSNDEYFVWLYRGENVYILNVDHYDVYTIEMKVGHILTQYSTGTQETIIAKLELVYKSFMENKKILATGLIDVGAYSITESLQKEIDKDNKKANVSSPLYNSNAANYNNRSTAVNYGRPYKRKEVSTSVIKRSTKYPISTAIERMKAKVEEIRKGEYEPPILAAIPADKEKAEDVKKSSGVAKNDDLYDDYYLNGGCGYGLMG